MSDNGEQRWKWTCPHCYAWDWCLRTTDVPSECTICYHELGKDDKHLMTKQERYDAGCPPGGIPE